MHKIDIQGFSCIKNATLEISRFTVLIGPQASGKSLISKLIYFFNGIALEHRSSDETENSIDDFKEIIKERFFEWFPITAWGPNQFKIEYTLGEYSIRLTRTKYKGALADNLRIWISKPVEQFHMAAQNLRKRFTAKSHGTSPVEDEYWDIRYRIQSEIKALFDRVIGIDLLASQIFIPAGRSFFTSAGKAITAFEHAKLFDPVTLEFGKRLANYRDRGGLGLIGRKSKLGSSPLSQGSEILGGKVLVDKGGEFLESSDGRKIPFSSLSSGQQELLPLLMILESLYTARVAGKRFVFIEEPEAHLFPAAQSQVVELFAAFSNHNPLNTILLTTHSPYVLSKINNLILAGQYGDAEDGSSAKQINNVVKSTYWLNSAKVAAYALQDGVAENIIDETGMIDANYLDSVSGSISREFNSLLDIGI